MKEWWYKIRNFFRNLYIYRKILSADYQFDYGYLLDLEKFKLQLMLKSFKDESHTDHTNDIRWISICIKLIDIIQEEKLCERAVELGDKLKARFESMKAEVPEICDIRGRGSMIAVEFKKADGTPDADLPKKAQAYALEKGLIILTCGMYYNVMRFLFPLTIEDNVFDEALAILDEAVRASR